MITIKDLCFWIIMMWYLKPKENNFKDFKTLSYDKENQNWLWFCLNDLPSSWVGYLKLEPYVC